MKRIPRGWHTGQHPITGQRLGVYCPECSEAILMGMLESGRQEEFPAIQKRELNQSMKCNVCERPPLTRWHN